MTTEDVGSCEEVLPGPELQQTHPTPQSDYTYWSSADMPCGLNLTSASQEEDVLSLMARSTDKTVSNLRMDNALLSLEECSTHTQMEHRIEQ